MSAGIQRNRTGLNTLAAAIAVVIEGGDKGSVLRGPTADGSRTLRYTDKILLRCTMGPTQMLIRLKTNFLTIRSSRVLQDTSFIHVPGGFGMALGPATCAIWFFFRS